VDVIRRPHGKSHSHVTEHARKQAAAAAAVLLLLLPHLAVAAALPLVCSTFGVFFGVEFWFCCGLTPLAQNPLEMSNLGGSIV
jgi:hypothetical protein